MLGENCNCYLIYRLLPAYSVLILLIDNNLHNMNMTKTWNFRCFLRLRETGETDQKISRRSCPTLENGKATRIFTKSLWFIDKPKLMPLFSSCSIYFGGLRDWGNRSSQLSYHWHKGTDHFEATARLSSGARFTGDFWFCIFIVAGFDDFLYIRIDRGLDIFATRMCTQLESVYLGAVLPELTFPMKRQGGIWTAMVPYLEH